MGAVRIVLKAGHARHAIYAETIRFLSDSIDPAWDTVLIGSQPYDFDRA